MKKFALVSIIFILFATNIYSKNSNYIDKIINLYNISSGGTIEYNATKTKDGYKLFITPKDEFLRSIFKKSFIDIKVDEGPIVSSPHFTIAKAGLSSKGLISTLLNPNILKESNSSLNKSHYIYEGIVGFSKSLDESFILEPIYIYSNNFELNSSKIVSKSSFNLDTFIGKKSINIDKLNLKESNIVDIKAKGLKIYFSINDKPIDNIALFSSIEFGAKKLNYITKDRKKDLNILFDIKEETKKVDNKFLNSNIKFYSKALDMPTIALSKGIKELNLNIDFKNLGIEGLLDFYKLQKEYDKLNQEIREASKQGDNLAIQKAVLKNQELTNKMVPMWNHLFIKDKTKIVVNIGLKSIKDSYIKLDLVYRGKPLSGDAQSAIISLMSEQLALFDGDFDIAIEQDLINSINPLSIMMFDLLKSKGFIRLKDGVYYIKGSLRGGKIIINNKSYTLPELTKAIF